MQLSLNHLEDYVSLIRPKLSKAEQLKTKQRIEEAVEKGERNLSLTRLALGDKGKIKAALSLSPMGDGWAFLSPIITSGPEIPKEQGLPLLKEVIDAAQIAKIQRISARIELDQLSQDYENTLIGLQFKKIGSRIEFKADVSLLPGEDGSPLSWVNMDALGFDKTADLLGEVGRGAPDWEDEDDPRELLKEYFGDSNLSSGPNCVHIGQVGAKNVALVIAQVDKRDGWSRLTYMGLTPEYQGKKLGPWVHRHGFAMLKAQGGQEYHGGCSMENKAMWALFERHGCRELRRLSEWSWRADSD